MNITDGIPGRSHNVVANEERGYAVAVGCGGRAGRNDTCVSLQAHPKVEIMLTRDSFTPGRWTNLHQYG